MQKHVGTGLQMGLHHICAWANRDKHIKFYVGVQHHVGADGSCPYLRMRKRHMVTNSFKVKTARNEIQSSKTLPRKIWRSVTQASGFESLLDQYSEDGSRNRHLINIKNGIAQYFFAVPVPTQWLQ